MSKPDLKTKKGKQDCVSFVFLIITIILLSTQLTITIVWRNQRAASPPKSEQTICEPCSELYRDGELPAGCEITTEDKGDKQCCCDASVAIDRIVENVAETRFNEMNSRQTASVIKSNCDDKKTSGLVSGLSYSRLKEETREKDLVYWQKSSKSILETVTHTNGRFFIKESGFYYVFSQIKYDHDPLSANNTDARQSHVLLKISYRSGDQNKLLENTRTFSELRTPENNGTSYIGAVFKLEEDDEIMIKSTHTHKLSGEEHENYFGLYII